MAYTAKDVQELRQRTGAGMMDCKKALEETGGDMDKAVEILRMKGIAKAEKRAGRTASEGQIVAATNGDGSAVALVEVNCETDFVGRNEEFGKLARSIVEHILADSTLDAVVPDAAAGALLSQQWGNGGQTVEGMIKDASARTGENIVVRRYARFVTSGEIGVYIHHNGKVATLVDVAGAKGGDVQLVARSIAEHLAAGVPSVALGVSRADIPADVVDRERRIFEEQARASGKPDNIIQKMIEGRVDKFYKEVSLVDQPWVRDDSRTIQRLLDEAGAKAGATLKVSRFARFQMGD